MNRTSCRISTVMDTWAALRALTLALWFTQSILLAEDVGIGEVKPADTVSFANDVVPVFTKAGCNAGSCHAKAGGGQNGFQLSLFGFDTEYDYVSLVEQARGRRVSVTTPEKSLILLKASGRVPHRGGVRLQLDSAGYQVVRRWIQQGGRNTSDIDSPLVALEVEPTFATLTTQAEQPLRAWAKFADGSKRDVTALAHYESNDKARAEVDSQGHVTTRTLPGRVSIMVRYQDRVAVANLAIPLGASVGSLPPEQNFVDKYVFASLKELGVPSSPICDDSTFLRRVTLDIAGRLPTETEATQFLADSTSDKRNRWIESLLQSTEYADYFANKWTTLLKNRRDDTSDLTSNFAFHAWIRDGLLANKPYDQMVRELLGATGTVTGNPAVAWYKRVKEPKEQLEDVSQLFLGVRLQCAQCHHHPFERWSQDDYYSLSAFFSQVGRKATSTRGEDLIFHRRGVATSTNPHTGRAMPPRALGDPVGEIAADQDPRLTLVDWMSSPTNPFFAKALANRYWKHFFHRGLIDPEDDIRDSNPPTHPELLDALADHIRKSHFDLRELVRVLTQSHAYQLSASTNSQNLSDTQNFSRFYPRRLPAEVLLDAIDQVAGTQTDFANLPPGTRAIALPDNSYNRASPFLVVFGRPENASVCECERVQSSSLSQSLHLLNGADVRSKLSADTGRAARLASSTRTPAENIRESYLAAFGRTPTLEEQAAALTYLAEPTLESDANGNTADEPKQLREKYEDLLWAFINTKEFLFNH